jgi:hypothetical protein
VAIVPSGHRLAGALRCACPIWKARRWKGIPGGDDTGPEVADAIQLLHMITVNRMIGVLPPHSSNRPRPAWSASR